MIKGKRSKEGKEYGKRRGKWEKFGRKGVGKNEQEVLLRVVTQEKKRK